MRINSSNFVRITRGICPLEAIIQILIKSVGDEHVSMSHERVGDKGLPPLSFDRKLKLDTK